MNAYMLECFKQRFKCALALFDQPVMDYAHPFMTVAFIYAPQASEYKRFFDAGWEPYGVIGQGRYPLNVHEDHYIEVTFKCRSPAATAPVSY